MGAHVGLLPDRTPLWRLFPLPGTTTRRLSPQKHPPQTHLVALMVRRASAWPAARTRPARTAGWQGRKEDEPGLAEAHGLNSTTTESACLRRSSCRLLILARERQTGGGPARCRTQPSTIPRLEDKQHAELFRASKDAVNTTPTDTSAGHRHFHVASSFGIRRRSDRRHKSVVREILVLRTNEWAAAAVMWGDKADDVGGPPARKGGAVC